MRAIPARACAFVVLVLSLSACTATARHGSAARPATVERPPPSAREGTVRPRFGEHAAGANVREGDADPLRKASVRPAEPAVPPLPGLVPPDDDGPLVAKIDGATPPRRAAALRLTEQGRELIARGEPSRAIELLERAIAVDDRTAYAYYFLAEAHEQARQPALARSFVARAEQLLAADPYWLGRVHALHGRLAEQEGLLDEARRQYERALLAWPRNGDAATGLARLDAPRQGAR